MKTALFLTLLTIAALSIPAYAAVINIPGDHSTIQAGIDAASDGDTIIVAPGTYYENINFNGKNITVASNFLSSGDFSDVESTIIDGSMPDNTERASCVLIVSGETSEAKLIGFTLQNGTGTKWVDEHGAGTFYEGGGILIQGSSPEIRYNIIKNNKAIRKTAGTVSAGGGGIRCGDGSPLIANNIFINNEGMYGGAIVFNYCDGTVTNNIFKGNKVWQAVTNTMTFGGGALWIYGSGHHSYIYNNTIIENSSKGSPTTTAAGKGGGILIWNTDADVKNNIVWGNTQQYGSQLSIVQTSISMEYNNIEDRTPSGTNISVDPELDEMTFIPADASPCIDGGDTAAAHNDPEDPSAPGNALYPSKGTVRNDIGAFGGAYSSMLTDVPLNTDEATGSYTPNQITLANNYPNPFNPVTNIEFTLYREANVKLEVFNITGELVSVLLDNYKPAGKYNVRMNAADLSSGVYIYSINVNGIEIDKKKMMLIK